MADSVDGLACHLLAHAALHDDLAAHSDEQRQWAADLREAAALIAGFEAKRPTRDADHCDYPDCEQHGALIIAQQREQIERLRRERDAAEHRSLAAMRNEISRLRAALGRIANQSARDYSGPEEEAYASRDIAAKALTEPSEAQGAAE